MPDGSVKLVPPPAERQALIERLHAQLGHYGVRRTADQVLSGHWWRSLHTDVAAVVSRCSLCDRVRSSFNSLQPQLKPLPVEPMFYRWGFDLCGEFPETARGYKWVMVAVEHFTKWVEVIPLRSKTPEETAAAAADIISRFGAPAEVVTDGGGEWEGPFAELMAACFIDHRITSANHPQANGLAERLVQVTKRALRKLCASAVSRQWDKKLVWLRMGYNGSRQASTGFSPYYLVYGRELVFPSAVRAKMEQPLDFDSPAAAASSVEERMQLLEQRVPVAMSNLKAAQHRDTLRYQQLRSGGYLPRVADFKVGDFVWLKRHKAGSSLVIQARPVVLRVVELRDAGVVMLQDKSGRTVCQQVSQLAPCHLPDLDSSLDPTLQGEDQDALCYSCGEPDPAGFMFCDFCNRGWHTYCCTPPLQEVPEGAFLCELCRAQGVTQQQMAVAQQQREQLRLQEAQPELFPLAEMRRRDERAAALHGRSVLKRRGRGWLWGGLSYRGALARPHYLNVLYADGSVEEGSVTEW